MTTQEPTTQPPVGRLGSLVIHRVPIDQVNLDPRNARRHSRANIDAIKDSLRRWGQRLPIVVRAGTVVGGNATVVAARELDFPTIDLTPADDLTADEATALAIVLNRSAELASWDQQLLLELLSAQPSLEGTGFSAKDITDLEAAIGAVVTPLDGDSDPDHIPPIPTDPVSRPGELWLLGPHRLLCGDARDPAAQARLLDGHRLAVAFTSPPYADRRKYDPSSGFRPIPPDEYVDWFEPVASGVHDALEEGGSWFVNIKAGVTPDFLDTELYVLDLVLAHRRRWGFHFATEFCWPKVGVPKRVNRRFKNQFEPIYQFTRGDWRPRFRPDRVRHPSADVPISGGPGVGDTNWAILQNQPGAWRGPRGRPEPVMDGHDNPDEARLGWRKAQPRGTAANEGSLQGQGQHRPGEYVVAGLAYPGNLLPYINNPEAVGHAAAFPVALPEWFLLAYSDPDDHIYDPFAGTGSVLLACHRQQRVGYAMEISPAYVDVACRRFQRHTGIVPIRAATGDPVDFPS
jgi:DNA modification methylase